MPRHPAQLQRVELEAFGCARVIDVGPTWADWVAFLDHVRQGNEVVIRHLHLMPPFRMSRADNRREFLWRCVHDIEARGSWIETTTGRRSTVLAERDLAIEDAIEQITRRQHAPSRALARKNGRKGGGVAVQFAPEIRRRAFEIYTSLNLSGDRLIEALREIGWSQDRCYREWGGRTTAKWE